ncbi:MAG: ferrous iron transport protein B [Actinomycetota bacterium]
MAGQPNVGKTTVFNLLTGGAQHVGNWPGKTVRREEGLCRVGALQLQVVDLPGTYSLTAASDEERIARDFILRERPVVVVTADATGMERSLYLLAEIAQLDVPVVLGLNMMDVARAQGVQIEPHVLEAALGVPVVPLVAVRGEGREELLAAICRVLTDPARSHPSRPAFCCEVLGTMHRLLEGKVPVPYDPEWVALKLLEGDEELLAAARGWLGPTDWETVHGLLRTHEDAFLDVAGARYEWIERMVRAAVVRPRLGPIAVTDRLDRIATHPLWGRLLLALVLGLVFAATFGLGAPLQRWLDESVLAGLATAVGDGLGSAPEWFRGLLVEGVIGGAGRVATLIPVLVVFFAGMAVLEDSGYLARAAFLLDGVMHRIGLHGKSFFPLFLGFGCSVPAVLGSRIVESSRSRLLTILLAPLVPCTGRLVVVAFVGAVLFGNTAPLVAGGLVAANLLVLAAVGAVFSRWVIRGEREAFIMVLPLYHGPRLGSVMRAAATNTWAFVRRAGTLIVAAAVVVWALSNYPGPSPEHSVLGTVGRALEPAARLAGMDWRLVVATLSGFMAKENVIATLGILYGAEASAGLDAALATAVTAASGLAFLVVQMLFVPCISTIVAIRQETGGWRWPLANSGLQLMVALAGGAIVFQAAQILGLGV